MRRCGAARARGRLGARRRLAARSRSRSLPGRSEALPSAVADGLSPPAVATGPGSGGRFFNSLSGGKHMLCNGRSLAMVIVTLSFAAGAANLGIVEGTVVGEGDAPVAGAKIQLTTREGRAVDEHVTDASGHFEFEQIPFGTYRIRASDPAGLVAAETIRVASGEVVRVALSLRPAAEQQVVVQGHRPL